MSPVAVTQEQFDSFRPSENTRAVKTPRESYQDPVPDVIAPLRDALVNESTPLAVRFRCLFSLKHHASLKPVDNTTIPAIETIAEAFASPSALLKHELAYCLGQSNNVAAIPFLQNVLEDKQQDPMCRHEAAEALGAIGDVSSLSLLQRHLDDETAPVVVKETCEIAIDRIKWVESNARKSENLKRSDFASIDPAPPFARDTKSLSIPDLQIKLLDRSLPLFERYRAMFALRDLASPPNLPTAVEAVNTLATGFTDTSALFRHEVAFVFGQLSHPASIPSLVTVLSNLEEESMVRHEAAEALGSLGEEDGVEQILRRFLDDEAQVVRESVVVALDMAEYERSGMVEYAALPDNPS